MQDKGHRRELQLTIDAIRSGKPSPISFEELVEVTETTFLVHHALATGEVIRLAQAAPSVAPGLLLPEMPDALQQRSGANGECVRA